MLVTTNQDDGIFEDCGLASLRRILVSTITHLIEREDLKEWTVVLIKEKELSISFDILEEFVLVIPRGFELEED